MEVSLGRGFSITRCRYLNGQGEITAVNGCCGKTFRELFPQTKEMTLDTFLDQWSKGMFLSLKTDGRTQESVSQKAGIGSWSGVCLTLNTSSPKDAVESSLYSVLEHGGGNPPVLFESESLRGNLKEGKGKGEGPSESFGGDFDEDGFCAERGGYKVIGALCAVDRKGIGNQYVDQGKVVMEPCEEEDTLMVSQENYMDITTNVAPPLKRRDYKAPHAVCYKEPKTYDMKAHHAPTESDTAQLTTGNYKGVRGDTPLVMDVVSWKERDRLAPIMNNMIGTLAASDYKGTSFVGYVENQKDEHDS